jgi:4-hydroxybenzoate polyprenyltransferase
VADVVTLAGLYTLRLLAGGAAAAVWVSLWLIAFSLCIFMSLALAKRYAELLVVLDNHGREGEARGRGYGVRDIRRVRTVGPAVGFTAAVVMALYMNSATVRQMYATPAWLWPVGPLVLAWIARVWWAARGRRLEEDPALFALKDPWSYLLGAGVAMCGVLAAMG